LSIIDSLAHWVESMVGISNNDSLHKLSRTETCVENIINIKYKTVENGKKIYHY